MLYNTKIEEQKQRLLEYVNRAIDNEWIMRLSRYHPQRTLHQNNYIHLLFSYFASQYGISKEEADIDYFRRKFNPDIFVREKINNKGERVVYLRSTTELDVSEMSLAIDRFRNKSVMEYGIYLPSKEDRDFIVHCEQEIESVKEFL